MSQSVIHILREAGRTPPLPLTLATPSGELTVTNWLRVLPQRRLVGVGKLAGQAVLVKLFIANRARQHWQREIDGLAALQAAQLQTPGVLAKGALAPEGFFICTDYLEEAVTLQQMWSELGRLSNRLQPSPENPEAITLLGRALSSIGLLHRAGLIQSDLHMGNFLLHGDQVHVIDGDAVIALSQGQPLSAKDAEKNLAVFFAQLDSCWDSLVELLLIDYLQVNAERALNPDRLMVQVREVRLKRLNDWLSKAVRDCTHFSVRRCWTRFAAVVREQALALGPILDHPNAPFAGAPTLKDGGSSSVTLVETAEGSLVVKRYNIKGILHWLTRFWRPSRAWHSWLAGHRLQFLGIATPAPLAMIESRFGPLRRRAWLVTEYCPGQNLLELFGADGLHPPNDQQGAALLAMTSQLFEARISHGDFKATNLLWDAGQVWLIDLDSMQAHNSESAFQAAWAKDRARLVRNWPTGSPLAIWLDARLPR
ncbi:lipopolysaccharide kinase InaA family protein [uncultured Halopseudomonas sp.]|uniref:lipopolysaccharide kinase InaA family protein n=1 Tax=uncultured Halopseudomonas sp. TaxID=2901193 RepID=UPI0030EC4CAA